VQVSNLQPTPTASGTITAPPGAVEPQTEEEPPPVEPPAEEPPSVEPPLEEPPTEERRPQQQASSPPSVAIRIDVDFEAGKATVSLDEASDEVKLAFEDGRWRLS
jgi:hypothetical protein